MTIQNVFSRRTGHPYQAKNLAGLPDNLRLMVESSLPPDDPTSTMIVIPPQTVPMKLGVLGGVRNVPEQVICYTKNGALHAIASDTPGKPGKVTYLRGETLLYVHLTIVLLYGRLELCGITSEGLTRIVVEYNSARQDLIQPGLQHILSLASKSSISDRSSRLLNSFFLNQLEQQSLKFKNGLQNYALQPGEQIIGYTYQPRISKRYWGVFHRLLAPAGLLALTDRELILIEEGRTSATSYGWFFTFCPRMNIERIEERPNGSLINLTFHLKKGSHSVTHQIIVNEENLINWRSLCASSLRTTHCFPTCSIPR